MDMLTGFIQIVCIGGLVYGLYLSITYRGPEEIAESYRRLQPHHFTHDPLITDTFASSRTVSPDRLSRL